MILIGAPLSAIVLASGSFLIAIRLREVSVSKLGLGLVDLIAVLTVK